MAESLPGALALMVPEPARQTIEALRQRYPGPHLPLPPHITLAYPPFVPPERWSLLRPRVAACFGAAGPLAISVATTGIFESPQRVLWLDPESDGAVEHIAASLWEHLLPDVLPPASDLPFTPHITLDFFATDGALAQARAAVDAALRPFSFVVAEARYFVQLSADGRWVPYDSVAL